VKVSSVRFYRKRILSSVYKGANGIIAMFSWADRASFESVEKWVDKAKESDPKDILWLLLSNKIDLDKRSWLWGRESLVEKVGMKFCEFEGWFECWSCYVMFCQIYQRQQNTAKAIKLKFVESEKHVIIIVIDSYPLTWALYFPVIRSVYFISI